MIWLQIVIPPRRKNSMPRPVMLPGAKIPLEMKGSRSRMIVPVTIREGRD
jgi:hypothetical protein